MSTSRDTAGVEVISREDKSNRGSKDREKQQKDKEEKAAAAWKVVAKDIDALMEIENEVEEDEETNSNMARVLDLETASPVRKRSRQVGARCTMAVVAATPPALRQSSFIPHIYSYP